MSTAFPDAEHRVLVHPGRLVIDVAHVEGWRAVTWEQLLTAFAASPDAWVAQTATAWLRHLDAHMPHVDSATVWGDLCDGENFTIAVRARMAWVYEHMTPPAGLTHDLVGSGAGKSWVARMYTAAAKPGYRIFVEMEERLAVYSYPEVVSADSRPPLGPSVEVLLNRTDVSTSAGFDWDYLHSMWPLMAAARGDWVQNRPEFNADHDREGWQRIVDKGAPQYLGIGFGERQARVSGDCMFGARIQLPRDVALADVAQTLQDTADLALLMARQPAPERATPGAL